MFRAIRLLDDGQPLAVPVTAVHTRSDGIVPWKTCLIQDAPTAENLRVRGSHIGLGFNPAACIVIADRLAQAEGDLGPVRGSPALSEDHHRRAGPEPRLLASDPS